MSESELLQAFYASTQVVISLFSIFFTITSAYIAGLYLFLSRAPLALKLLAFFLLSIALAFLGGAVAIQQGAQAALIAAWAKLPSPTLSLEVIRTPLPLPGLEGLHLHEVGTVFGWVAASSVYLALAYMTFLYRWKE